jgi:hypothetical protein
VNVVLGLVLLGAGAPAMLATDVLFALAIGAAGYGVSITLWVKGARDLGAARGQVIFATAPFLGALVAWTALGDPVTAAQLAAIALAAGGVWLSLDSVHEHRHRHDPVTHDHEHTHPDDHHTHVHADGFAGRHSHPHTHDQVLVHAHPHLPDLHHRHAHHGGGEED